MRKILVVEDDEFINKMLYETLTNEGYVVTSAYSGTEGLLCLKNEKFSLVILDIMLPGKPGDVLLREIRKWNNTPIIILTAILDKDKVVELLRCGANDYITKPFNSLELLARIEARLRDSLESLDENLAFKNLVLDTEKYDGFIKGEALNFSKTEFLIIKLLMSNKNKVFTKNNIYSSVWENDFMMDQNLVNVYISKIRSKISKCDKEEYINTVWGIGFKLNT